MNAMNAWHAWRGIVAVAGFQLRRLVVPQRLALAVAGAAFPAAVILAARRIGGELDRDFAVALCARARGGLLAGAARHDLPGGGR